MARKQQQRGTAESDETGLEQVVLRGRTPFDPGSQGTRCGGVGCGVWSVECGQNKKYKRQGTHLTGLFISIHKRRNCDIVAQTCLGGRDQSGDK